MWRGAALSCGPRRPSPPDPRLPPVWLLGPKPEWPPRSLSTQSLLLCKCCSWSLLPTVPLVVNPRGDHFSTQSMFWPEIGAPGHFAQYKHYVVICPSGCRADGNRVSLGLLPPAALVTAYRPLILQTLPRGPTQCSARCSVLKTFSVDPKSQGRSPAPLRSLSLDLLAHFASD